MDTSAEDCAEQEIESPFSDFDDSIFRTPAVRRTLTRWEKRKARHEHGLVRAKDLRQLKRHRNPSAGSARVAGLAREEMQQMQESDETLEGVRESVSDPSGRFFEEDGLLFKKWEPPATQQLGSGETVDQLILPKECRPLALKLTHSLLLAGHLERKKTLARLSQHFYWPSMHQDVADFCRCCETCQKCCKRKPP